MNTKRVRFQNAALNEPATAKQVAYVRDLLAKEPGYLSPHDDPVVHEFVARMVRDPLTDLTKWEASNLISLLQFQGPDALADLACEAIEGRTSGAKITSHSREYALLAFREACAFLAEYLENLA